MQYKENRKLLKSYISGHHGLEKFVHSFTEMQKAVRGHRNTVITISIGKMSKKRFLFYLNSSVKNPRILFTSRSKDNKSIPQIIISDKAYTVVCFSLDDVKIISYKTENNGTSPFDKYDFVVHIGKFDYEMEMIIYRD